MSSETNIAVVRRYIEEWANRGDEATLHAVIAPDWGSHGTQSASATPAGLPTRVAGAKQLHDEIRAIWPDNQWSIEDIFGAGDQTLPEEGGSDALSTLVANCSEGRTTRRW